MFYDLHAFVLYSLRTALCLALFYLFFKWVLSRDTLHRLNRVVLLTAVVVAFLLPVCRVTIIEVVPAPEPMPIPDELPMEEIVTTLPDDGIAWQQVVGALFLLAMAVMVGRMALATFSVWRTIHRLKRSAEEVREVEGATIIIASEELSPFSWGRYIVLSARDAAENGEVILSHELAHIRLGHTWDLVLFDLLMVGQWFNPAMWLLRRELRAIHEYEADRAVIALGVDPRSYQLLLIKKAVGERWCSVANSLNHSNLKNRITMMLQKRTSRWAAAKSLLLLPLVGLAVGAFAETRYLYVEDKDSAKNQISQPAEEGLLKLRLTDEKGAPIVGAVVVKAGTNEGICTDPEGRGTLQVKAGDKLICSMIGKETLHYTVEQLPTEELTLQLKTEVVEIDELVVVGYGTKEQTKATADEEAVPFMLVDDERKKEIMAQRKRDMEQAIATSKAEFEAAKAELEAAKADLEAAKAEMQQAKAAADEEVFLIVESMPKFEGGDINTFRQWVQMRVQYPKELQDAGVSGRVIVQFVVDTDGSVTNVQTLRTPDKRLSDQVVELVKKSPKWQPGMQRGVAVKASMTFPIEFKVSQPEEVTPNGVTPAVAEFAGGDYRRFEQWAQAKVQYPEAAQKEGVKGEVMVTFVVKANGEVGDVDLIGKVDKRLAKEALRVVKSSPKWTPALKDGKAVAAKYGIKLRFDDTPFLVVEQMPTFEGGDIKAFRQWIEARIAPQKGADGKVLEGMVICSFVIETDGSVSEFTPLRSPDKRLTEEVERVVKLSPRWEAGRQRGQKVRVKITLPVQFKA
ncbi:MAG: TonB family protein [Alistipes sp.]|nr:TonB family protein [Alistipes sp.]